MTPPPGSPVTPLTADEKLMFVRWIDLGAPIDTGNPDFGWFLDDLKPSVALSLPRARANPAPLDTLQAGWDRPVDVSVRDQQGNTTCVRRAFFVGADDTIFRDGYD